MKVAGSKDGFPRPYGKYQLLARIGHGGMAEIFRARLPGAAGFEKIVVIKRLLPHLIGDPSITEMFVHEAKLAAEAHHRNIVQVFELGQIDDGELYIAMEHVAGTDLRQILREAAVNAMRIPPWFSVHVLSEVLDGLSFAHGLVDETGRGRNVVHRDVTPANIFLSYLGDVKLGDFGVARDDRRDNQTRTGQIKGKVPYMAPEQLYGRQLDARTDVFAAGVVLWECLTQRRLFGGRPDMEAMNLICHGERKPPSEYVPDVPAELDACVLRALANDPERRIVSAQEFRDQLQAVLPSLRARVLQKEIRHVIEVLLGNHDANASAGPKAIDDEAVVKHNFIEPTPDLGSQQVAKPPAARARWSAPVVSSGHAVEVMPQVPLVKAASAPLEHLTASLTGMAEPILRPGEVQVTDDFPRELLSRQHARKGSGVAGDDAGVDLLKSSQSGIYEGPHPFWVQLAGAPALGPLTYADALEMIRSEATGRGASGLRISGNQKSWVGATSFALLTGQEMLFDRYAQTEKEHPGNVGISGQLENISLVRVFGRLARERSTGRLMVSLGGRGPPVRREITIVDGRPTYVYANTAELQLPELIKQRNVVSEQQLGAIVHRVIIENRSLESVIAERIGVDVARYFVSFMKERLSEAFRWSAGRFSLDAGAVLTHSNPFAPSLLALLPEMVQRGRTQSELYAELLPDMDTKLERSEQFHRGVAEMRLTEVQHRAAFSFGGGKTLGLSLHSDAEDERIHLTMAYLLLETDLLLRA